MHHLFKNFQNFLSSTNFLKIVSNSAIMHHFVSLLLKFSQEFRLQEHHFKYHQRAPYIVLGFKMFSAVRTSEKILSLLSTFTHHFQLQKTSFKMRKNAPFSILSFKTFSAVATLVYRSGNEQTCYHL